MILKLEKALELKTILSERGVFLPYFNREISYAQVDGDDLNFEFDCEEIMTLLKLDLPDEFSLIIQEEWDLMNNGWSLWHEDQKRLNQGGYYV